MKFKQFRNRILKLDVFPMYTEKAIKELCRKGYTPSMIATIIKNRKRIKLQNAPPKKDEV